MATVLIDDALSQPKARSAKRARRTRAADVPWIRLGEGRELKPLRFLSEDRGYVALLRIEPGAVVPVHRHTGEVHTFMIEGERELHTGEIIGPGDYVFEPAGHIDTWKGVGESPALVLVVVYGAADHVGPTDQSERRFSSGNVEKMYRDYCDAQGVEALDLVD
jgi:quercetin dioxygenase-like cupin family protein